MRMNVLLSEEEQCKTHSHSVSTKSTATVGASSTSGLVTEGRGGGAKRQSVAAEADVLFTTNTGTNWPRPFLMDNPFLCNR